MKRTSILIAALVILAVFVAVGLSGNQAGAYSPTSGGFNNGCQNCHPTAVGTGLHVAANYPTHSRSTCTVCHATVGDTPALAKCVVCHGSAVVIAAVPTSDHPSAGCQGCHPVPVANYTITASTGANGTISPLGAQTVAGGANLTFTMTPAAGYHVAGVLVDGTAVTGAPTSYTFNAVAANHTISVTFAANTTNYTITSSTGANGTISPLGARTVAGGANLTFTMTPAAGYHVAGVLVDGTAVTGAPTSYTFNAVAANHTISVTFAANTTNYTITSSTGANGTISPLGARTVAGGANLTFTMTPAAGYHVAGVLVDGTAVTGAPTSYTFNAVAANHTISVTFAANTTNYTITSSTGANGTISPLGARTVAGGANLTFTMTPAAGYHVAGVLVDGTAVTGAPTSYTFNAVAANHTISVTFAANTVGGGRAQVVVRVVNAAGNPINHAKVVLKKRGSDERERYTNSVGVATFSRIPYGTYMLVVSKDKYARSSDTLAVQSPTVQTTRTLLPKDEDHDDEHGSDHESSSPAPR